MAFRRAIRVFARDGLPLGEVTGWSTTGPRSYRLNDVPDFSFALPRNDGDVGIFTGAGYSSVVGSSQATQASAPAVAPALPAGWAAGDLIVAAVSYDRGGSSATAVTAPAGWERLGTTIAGVDHGLALFARTAAAGDGAPSFATDGPSRALAAVLVAYRGASGVYGYTGEAHAGASTLHPSPKYLTSVRRQRVLTVWAGAGASTWSALTGTELQDAHVANAGIMAADSSQASAGIHPAELGQASVAEPACVATVAIVSGPSVESLLSADNLIYVENDAAGMEGWGGAVIDAEHGGDASSIRCTGVLGLLGHLGTALIEQSEGRAADLARRLVGAAQAKQAAHGDLVVGFVEDASQPHHGRTSYQGDVLAGLQQLADRTLSEFYARAYIESPSGRLRADLHWGAQYDADLTAFTIHDGAGGHLAPTTRIRFSGDQRANYGRLVGAPTSLQDYVDYSSVAGVIREITPEVAVALEEADVPGARRREAIDFQVNWGYPEDQQRSLAKAVQQKYVGYYKRFLYAHHERWGMPFLEGYEWSGPPSQWSAKKLVLPNYRTVQEMGWIGARSVIVDFDPDGDGDARIDDWRYKTSFAADHIVGIATAFDSLFDVLWLASSTGLVYRLDARQIGAAGSTGTYSAPPQFLGATAAEQAKGLATDPNDAASCWVLATQGGSSTVKKLDLQGGAQLARWTVPAIYTDLAVDSSRGLAYLISSGADVDVRDLSSGGLLRSFAHGVASPVGLVVLGGIVYVLGAGGRCRMLHEVDGALAAEQDTGQTGATGLYLSTERGEAWVPTAAVVTVFHAAIAAGTIDGPGPAQGAPGFDAISAGQFVHIVAADKRDLGAYDDGGAANADYVPMYRSQHGWGTKFDNANCTCAVAAMCFDRQTGGLRQPTPPQMRNAQRDFKGGISRWDAAEAFVNYSKAQGIAVQHLDVVDYCKFSEIIKRVKGGVGAMLEGDNDQMPNPSGGFLGGHALYVQRIRDNGDWLVFDPNEHGPARGKRWVAAEHILNYGKKWLYYKAYGRRWPSAPDRMGVAFTAAAPANRRSKAKSVFIVYSKGHWTDEVLPPQQPGDPGTVQKRWDVGGTSQGFYSADVDVMRADPEQVVQGEEGRVDDWDPYAHGYGVKGPSYYKTASGLVLNASGWHLVPWDVPPSTFWTTPPAWPEGEAYVRLALTKLNRELGSQALLVRNVGGLWGKVTYGARFTLHATLQGPHPDGILGVVRVVGWAPDEAAGEMQLLTEWVG